MVSSRTKHSTRRKPIARRKTTRRTSTVSKKKPVARKTTTKKPATKSKTLHVVDSKGKATNLRIIVK